MSRRIWIAEGFASDGAVYGRTLQLPNGAARDHAAMGGGLQRVAAKVLKVRQADFTSCPCMDAMLPRQQDEVRPDLRGG